MMAMPQRSRPSRKSRLEVRLPAEARALIRRTAELQGRSVTDFVITAAHDAAKQRSPTSSRCACRARINGASSTLCWRLQNSERRCGAPSSATGPWCCQADTPGSGRTSRSGQKPNQFRIEARGDAYDDGGLRA